MVTNAYAQTSISRSTAAARAATTASTEAAQAARVCAREACKGARPMTGGTPSAPASRPMRRTVDAVATHARAVQVARTACASPAAALPAGRCAVAPAPTRISTMLIAAAAVACAGPDGFAMAARVYATRETSCSASPPAVTAGKSRDDRRLPVPMCFHSRFEGADFFLRLDGIAISRISFGGSPIRLFPGARCPTHSLVRNEWDL